MPKIKNWSRRQDLECEAPPIRVWEHDETGEIAWLSEKIPRDGYYFMVCGSVNEFRGFRHSNSERYRYSHLKHHALELSSRELRENTDGFGMDEAGDE